MKYRTGQEVWAPSEVTIPLPVRMRLAPEERERLWKGLERFVNCDDSLGEFKALGLAFSKFWPIQASYSPYRESLNRATRRSRPIGSEMPSEQVVQQFNWHPACHALFLFYRDRLRDHWVSKPDLTGWTYLWGTKFLLGVDDYNEQAIRDARNQRPSAFIGAPGELVRAWKKILQKFPTAMIDGHADLEMLWGYGDIVLLPRNDFGRAFYLLFRQCWRARVCPRCKTYFIARKPKQRFCGTGCSAGSRLASKRKWWRSVGAERRTKQIRKRLGRKKKERKQR